MSVPWSIHQRSLRLSLIDSALERDRLRILQSNISFCKELTERPLFVSLPGIPNRLDFP